MAENEESDIYPEWQRIKILREKHGISQKELAEMLYVAPPSVSNWEHGKTEPTKANIMILAKLFGVSIDYLFGKDRDNIPFRFRIAPPSKHKLVAVPDDYPEGIL